MAVNQTLEPEKAPEPPVKTLRFKFGESKTAKKLFELLAVLFDEPIFVANANGLTLSMLDPSRVAMYRLELPKAYFEEYTMENADTMQFCFDLSTALSNAFKHVYKDETTTVEVNLKGEAKDGFSRIYFTQRQRFERKFEQYIIDDSEIEASTPTPKVNWTHQAKLDMAGLEQAVKDFGSYIEVNVPETLDKTVFSEKGDITVLTVTLNKGGSTLFDVQAEKKEACRVLFSISYIQAVLAKMKPLASVAYMELKTDFPTSITIQLGPDNSRLTFYMAPRIETDC